MGFSGLLVLVVGIMVMFNQPAVEGSPTPGTCLPIDKGGTSCDGKEFREEFSLPYSTTEQLTGETWVDGKPVHRMVVTGTVTAAANVISMVSLTFGVSSYITAGGTLTDISGRPISVLGSRSIDNAIFSSIVLLGNNSLSLQTITTYARTNMPYTIWVEYTKL